MSKIDAAYEEAYFEVYGGSRTAYRDPILKRWFRLRLVNRFVTGGRLLELGCAYGYLLQALEQRFECEGTDISEHAIQVAKSVVSKASLEQAPIEASLAARSPETYDVVIAFDILEHLDKQDLPKITEAIARLLRPGGVLLVSVPNWDSIGRRLKGRDWTGFRDTTHTALLERWEWIDLLGRHLRVRSVGGDGLWDAPYLPILPRYFQKALFASTSLLAMASGGRFPKLMSENLVIACVK